MGVRERCDETTCASLTLEGLCEKPACTLDGACIVVAKDGESCGVDGTCRGYACIGSDTTLAAGEGTSCVRDSAGLVWCWGENDFGQLGDRRLEPRSTPYLVPRIGTELAPARSVSIGYAHGCALLEDGKVICWGNDSVAQSSGREPAPTIAPIGPTVVEGLPPTATVVTGVTHTCILSADRRVYCWGANNEGQCGVGSAEPIVREPTEVTGIGTPMIVSTAKNTTCTTDGIDVHCWGDNTHGQLGRSGPPRFSPTPVKIAGLTPSGVLHVTAAWGTVCAVVSSTALVQCWGNNRWGQHGDGVVIEWGDSGPGNGFLPDPVYVVDPTSGAPVKSGGTLYSGTGSHICIGASAYFPDFLCWGENSRSEFAPHDVPSPFGAPDSKVVNRPMGSPPARGALRLALGNDHTCALRSKADGYDVDCWGDLRFGQLGDGLPIGPGARPEAKSVVWPSAPGGLRAQRQMQERSSTSF